MTRTAALILASALLAPNTDPLTAWAEASDHFVDIWASHAELQATGLHQTASPPDHMQRMRAPVCLGATGGIGRSDPVPCPGDPVVPLPECGDAATLPTLWERPVPDAVPGPWQLIGPSVCATPDDVTPAMVLAAFRRLPLAPSALVVQPDRGWVLLNKPTVVHADPAPQTLTTTILGTTVTIVAMPTTYTWDFGDGATLTTTDPGRPWPDGTLTHTYTHAADYRIALTTAWSATYTLAGNPTVRDVPGIATTTAISAVEAREQRSHLVAAPCIAGATAPGC